MSAGNTLSSVNNTVSTEKTTDLELSITSTLKRSLVNKKITDHDSIATSNNLILVDDTVTERASPYKVNAAICCAIIFMVLGKIIIPILVSTTFAFELEIVDKWNVKSVEVAQCHNINDVHIKTLCNCDANYFTTDDFCEMNIEDSYIETSIAVNTMVLIVEAIWFMRMLFGLRRHSLCNKLGIFEAIGQLTRDSKCCLFVWRIFEFAWYIAVIFQYENLHCKCVNNNDKFKWTTLGIFYQISYYLDVTAVCCLTLYLLSKTIFYCLMGRMTKTHGAYYDMGAFFAVLKVYYIDGKSFGNEDSMSVWSPLKQREDDIRYTAKNLKLHYKGWK